jgi:hypothetical protein
MDLTIFNIVADTGAAEANHRLDGVTQAIVTIQHFVAVRLKGSPVIDSRSDQDVFRQARIRRKRDRSSSMLMVASHKFARRSGCSLASRALL